MDITNEKSFALSEMEDEPPDDPERDQRRLDELERRKADQVSRAEADRGLLTFHLCLSSVTRRYPRCGRHSSPSSRTFVAV